MSDGGGRQRNWKGQSERVIEPVRHQWQSELDQAKVGRSEPVRVLRRTLTFLLLLSFGMLLGLVYLLLHAPTMTPVISVAATSYVWPLPPNAWAKEDVIGLSSLKGKTILLKDSSNAWQSKLSSRDDLKTQLREVAPIAQRSGSLVLYLNMHGAVNEQGEACLIPPGAGPLTTSQWISIKELGDVIKENVPKGVKVLLVLDCVHLRVNWNIAQLNNTFIDRLESWAASTSRPESIVVLASCSSDQQSWSGPELQSSIFATELRIGLAGAADRSATTSTYGTGNGDGAVSVRELTNYLISAVDRWALSHRGASQVPRSMPEKFEDFRVTWSLKNGELSRQIADAFQKDVAAPSVSMEEMGGLCRSIEGMRELSLYRYDPKSWAELEQNLQWLEQLSMAGSAYSELALQQVFPMLKKRLTESLERARELSLTDNEAAKSRVMRVQEETDSVAMQLPSLALMEFTGDIPSSTAGAIRRRIAAITATEGQEPIGQITASLGLSPEANSLNELNFVGISQKYDCWTVWPDQTVVQELLELRDRNEKLAVAGDIRGHRWRRPALNAADQTRRKSEDRLILGPELLLSENKDLRPWNALRKHLDAIDKDGESVAARVDFALGLRDRGLSEVSYLASWICSPDTEMENLGEWKTTDSVATDSSLAQALLGTKTVNADPYLREQLAIQQLTRLINGLHELGELLGQVSPLGEGKMERLDEVVAQVKRDRDSLLLLVNDHLERALNAVAGSKSTIRSMESFLHLPFLAVDKRLAVSKKIEQQMRAFMQKDQFDASERQSTILASLAERFRSGSKKAEPVQVDDSADESKPMRYSERMRSWGIHPLGGLMRLKAGLSLEAFLEENKNLGASDLERELNAVDSANANLRRHFQPIRTAGIESVLSPYVDEWSKASLAEHVERATVPLCPVRSEANASSTFRKLAFKDLLLWYANRIIDDYYADGSESPIIKNNSESYFERSARQVLANVALIQSPSASMEETARLMRDRLEVLGPIARNGIRMAVKLGPPIAGSDRTAFDVSVQPTVASVASGKPWTMPIPNGLATLLVRNPTGILRDARAAIPMPLAPQSPNYSLMCPPLDRSQAYESVVVFRGHEVSAPMFAGQGILVDFRPRKYDTAELILFGDRQRQPSIVFVLDCSWSMGEEIPIEAIDLKSQSRLDQAKASVLRMLSQMAASPDARVGLRLFGHRLGWSRPVDEKTGFASGKTQVLVQPNYPETIPDDLVPSRDIEAILPLGRFTPNMVAGLSNRLSKIVPWGQSPLYLSIIESLRDFKADDESTAKSIVVITDGDNFQFNASGRPGGEAGSATTLEDVFRAWNNNKIPLFILGVGVSDRESPNARKTLRELAEKTKGKYYDVENGGDLMRALSEQLSMGIYRVNASESTSTSRTQATPIETKLNLPVVIDKIPLSSKSYDVSFQSILKSFEVKGGESLEFYLSDDGQDIVSNPYDRSSPRAATLMRAGDGRRMIARVHRPSQQQNGVLFPISIQDPESHFTPRPTELWIEIVPIAANVDKPRQTYVFYDANYEANTPVPMVAWHASNWPAAATMADVRIWAKYESTPNLQSIPLNQLLLNPQRFSEGFEVDGVDGIKLLVNLVENQTDTGRLEIQVTELHSERSRGVGSIRVELEMDPSVLPSHVTRRFEPASKMAIHTFEIDSSVGKSLLRSPSTQLTIQSRTAAHAGTWRLQADQPIRVEVNSVPETLPNIGFPPAGVQRK